MTKRAAVIGAGIFGNSIAAELSKSMDVVLFEKEAEIMTKAS
jgi:L-2-hydroxyglutarate oxidase LhgO